MNVLDQKKEMCLSFDTPPYITGSFIYINEASGYRFLSNLRSLLLKENKFSINT